LAILMIRFPPIERGSDRGARRVVPMHANPCPLLATPLLATPLLATPLLATPLLATGARLHAKTESWPSR
jgi:hypothetical protein